MVGHGKCFGDGASTVRSKGDSSMREVWVLHVGEDGKVLSSSVANGKLRWLGRTLGITERSHPLFAPP